MFYELNYYYFCYLRVYRMRGARLLKFTVVVLAMVNLYHPMELQKYHCFIFFNYTIYGRKIYNYTIYRRR